MTRRRTCPAWANALVGLLTVWTVGLEGPALSASEPVPLLSTPPVAEPQYPQALEVLPGSSSRQTRQTAIDALGLKTLAPAHREQAELVLGSVSLFRRLSTYSCQVDPRVHQFFTQYPDVAVSIWRAMGVSSMEMRQTGPDEYEIETADGTIGTVTRLRQTADSSLILCSGLFKSPYLAKPIESRALMHLHTKFDQDAQGRPQVTYQADLFVCFPSQGVETVARLISPISNVIMDRNFEEISLFLQVMGQAMSRQPGWIEHMAVRLDGILPGRSDELLKLTAVLYVEQQKLQLHETGAPVTLEAVRPPVIPAGNQQLQMR